MLIKGCLLISNQDIFDTSPFLSSISLDRTIAGDSSLQYLNPVDKDFLPQLIICDISIVSPEMLKTWKGQIGEPSEIIALSHNISDAEKCMSLDHISAFLPIPASEKNYAALLNRTLKVLVYSNLKSTGRQLIFLSGVMTIELDLNEVLYVEDKGKSTRVTTATAHYDTDEPYFNLCFQLAGFSFLRVSPTIAVNFSKIDTVSATHIVVGEGEIEISGHYQNKLARVFDILFNLDLLSL